jgi:MFS family permease
MRPSEWLLLSSLYITQSLGPGFFLIALVAIMRQQGAPLKQLSVVPLLGSCWVLKFLWAPLVDRIGFGRLGHYRGWLLLTQSAMVLTFLAIGRFDATKDVVVVMSLFALQSFLAATQDVAADGIACGLLSAGERGVGNGVQYAGNLIGQLLGGGAILMVHPYVGWQGCMVILALGASISLPQLLLFRERNAAVRQQKIGVHMGRLWRFWKKPGHGRWLAMLLLYPMGVCLGYMLITPILTDIGWSMGHIGLLMNGAGALLGVLSSMATGLLIRRLGRRPVLIGASISQVIGLLSLALLPSGYVDESTVCFSVCIFYLGYSPVMVIMSTIMMDHVSKETPATDYTMQYSVFGVTAFSTAALSTTLADLAGYLNVLIIAITVACLSMLPALRFKLPVNDAAEPAPESSLSIAG